MTKDLEKNPITIGDPEGAFLRIKLSLPSFSVSRFTNVAFLGTMDPEAETDMAFAGCRNKHRVREVAGRSREKGKNMYGVTWEGSMVAVFFFSQQ